MTDRIVMLELAKLEAAHLTDLVEQFIALLDEPAAEVTEDPAIRRLVPDAYRDDASAADEFRELTQSDLLTRRAEDAATVLASLRLGGERLSPGSLASHDHREAMTVSLDALQTAAWLRTLASLRLVLATRLGVRDEDEDDHADDPRFGVYDWLGYRLEGLLRALED